ncbi:MAG: hypothetical protein AAF288_13880 [Planctomycetota bacterium]
MNRFLSLLLLCTPAFAHADEKLLDFWDEELRLFGVANDGQEVDHNLDARRGDGFKPRGFALDHADAMVGDLSVRYMPAGAGMPERFGFVAGLWGELWELSPDHELKLSVQTQGDAGPQDWTLRLVDADGNAATGTLERVGGDWAEYTLPLSGLTADAGFAWGRVALCDIEAAFAKGAQVHLDGVRFEHGDDVIGVTDKPLAQRMAEAEASRAMRIEHAFQAAANDDKEGMYRMVSAFAKLMTNQDLETANRHLVEELRKSNKNNTWSLFHTPYYCRVYFWFSNTHGKYPGRMTPETEALLLETLWERTKLKNDIHWARQSIWYLDGSENHDLNAKASSLVTSYIFMNEPGYKDRVYPNYGFGGAYGYGRSGYYGPGVDPATRHGGGRANLSDGQDYTAKDHYEAWLAYFKAYFPSRAERGFFLEYGSNTYSKHTLNFVDLAYQYSGDEELKSMIGDFLTLYWAEWAQVSISGDRGGPKARHHKGVFEGNGTSSLVSFKLGGYVGAGVWWYWNLINDHELPPVVWKMILDRQGMGHYTFRARGIGEEENVLPRPRGTERSLVVDTDARFLKSTYVTPDYSLGTQMDHPSAVHSHLSMAGRWHGMTFAQDTKCRIVPVALSYTGNRKTSADYNMEGMWHTAHHGRTLVVQQSRRWYGVHPDWFPANIRSDLEVGIWMGKDWDRKEEVDGWVFVQSGEAYAAVRPVLWDEEYERNKWKKAEGSQSNFNKAGDDQTVKLRTDAYAWNDAGTILLVEGNHTPVLIEAGHADDYADLEAFMADVLDNPLALYKTVVPGDHTLVYTGSGSGAQEMTFNTAAPAIPTVGGAPIDYSHPMTFDSPTMQSVYKSGVIHIEFDGDVLELDFTE